MFDLTPDPVAFQIGPIPVLWYGLAYAAGLVAVYFVVTRLARVGGRNPELVGNGILVIAVAALIGGRLYHVIDQWERYAADPLSIILPPYSGLGVYGGIITGTLAAWVYIRWIKEPFWTWADIIAPALFAMQAVGRWGNFFNQELYGPPTTLPWGIPIECDHRIPAFPCDTFPFETTRFHPLFLYESISGLLGLIVLSLLFVRYRHRFAPGTLLFVFFIWYGVVRFSLEALRENNWLAFGVPTAQIVSIGFILVGFVGLLIRNSGPAGRRRRDEAADDEAAREDDEAAEDVEAAEDEEADDEGPDDRLGTPGPDTPPAGR